MDREGTHGPNVWEDDAEDERYLIESEPEEEEEVVRAHNLTNIGDNTVGPRVGIRGGGKCRKRGATRARKRVSKSTGRVTKKKISHGEKWEVTAEGPSLSGRAHTLLVKLAQVDTQEKEVAILS
ncbi:hypothetical protein C0992_000631, partial [Termitomyces sp. T32_za158]